MTRANHTLDELCCLLSSRPVSVGNWMDVIELANRAWVTPALHGAIVRSPHKFSVPADVRDYLAFIHTRNSERNQRIKLQIIDVATRLNGEGIVPALLKGAALLMRTPRNRIGNRITGDIDLGVELFELDRALTVLRAAGYRDIEGMRGLKQPRTVAVVEVRARKNAPQITPAQVELERDGRRIDMEGATIWMSSSTSLAMHLLFHDLVKEGDCWRLRLNLRHLVDLAELTKSSEGIDWERIRHVPINRRWSDTVDAQIHMMDELLGTQLAPTHDFSLRARIHHFLRLGIVRHPRAGLPLRITANVHWGFRRILGSRGTSWPEGGDVMKRASRTLLGRAGEPKL